MSRTATDPARRRAQRQLAILAAAVVLVLAVTALVAVRLLGSGGPEVGRGGLEAGPEAGQGAGLPGRAATPAASPGRAPLTWREVAGVRLPFSAVHGPRVTDHGRAAGYSHTRQGAALAAVQVLDRTSATAGPVVYRPVLAGQVAGANAVAMSQRLDERYQQLRHQPGLTVTDGEPIPGNNATVAGYLLDDYDEQAGTALAEVLMAAPDLSGGQVVAFAVGLQWTDGDWRVLAPPNGEWGTLARQLPGAPAGTLDYGQVS
jgi:hypothetical protein